MLITMLTTRARLALSCRHGVWPSQKAFHRSGALRLCGRRTGAPHAFGCGTKAPAEEPCGSRYGNRQDAGGADCRSPEGPGLSEQLQIRDGFFVVSTR